LLFIHNDIVEQLLTMQECIDVQERAFHLGRDERGTGPSFATFSVWRERGAIRAAPSAAAQP
jgi:hypothetical protein